MTDEAEVQNGEEEVEMVFEGVIPEGDLESYLEVNAKATIKDDKGGVAGYKGATGYFRFGKDLDESVNLYTGQVVHSNYRAQAKIRLQSLMRSWILAGKDIGELLATWKPGIQMERTPTDPLVAAENKFDAMSADEQKAFIEKLLAKQAGR